MNAGEPARIDADNHNHGSELSFGCPQCSNCGQHREPGIVIVLREQ